jgi:hypothetical protein
MATSKTGSFYLTETVNIPNATAAGTMIQGTLDLSAYVNVPTGQALAIESVDFITQAGTDFAGRMAGAVASDTAISMQLSDLNPGTALVVASDQSLVASGQINVDFTNNVLTHSSDFFPDNFGPASLSEAFMVVNDTLFLTVSNGDALTTDVLNCTVRVRCRVVKLSTKDWMAIAIQSTASDN